MADKWDIRGMRLAREVAAWSRDPSSQVGAYIADHRHRPLSFGFNGFPRGVADDGRLHDRELKYKIILHAEVNALHNATASLEGATIYVHPFLPCSQCAAQIIQVGIARVVYFGQEIPERWIENFKLGESLLGEAGVATVRLLPDELSALET